MQKVVYIYNMNKVNNNYVYMSNEWWLGINNKLRQPDSILPGIAVGLFACVWVVKTAVFLLSMATPAPASKENIWNSPTSIVMESANPSSTHRPNNHWLHGASASKLLEEMSGDGKWKKWLSASELLRRMLWR